MRDNPCVSIVISAYNYGAYLNDCLDSCVNQTYDNIEIVVVDDASTDDTIGVIHAWQAKDSRIVCKIHEKNKGYAASRNSGVLLSQGEYIAIVDADDRLVPDSIERRAKYLSEHPRCDMVHGPAFRWYGWDKNHKPILKGVNNKTYCHAQGRMYRRVVFERFGLYYEPLRSKADKEFVYRLGVHPLSPLPKKIKDKKLKLPVAWYRKHDNAMHIIRKQKKPELNIEIEKVFRRRIKQLKRDGITRQNTRFLNG